MLVMNRFVIGTAGADPSGPPDPDTARRFAGRAHTALAVLAARPGYLRGQLTRSLDEPAYWCLVTEWESVGAYRRALGAYEVKVHATPLLAESVDEPSAYEALAVAESSGPVVVLSSDRTGS